MFDILLDVGLSDKEAKVYISLLRFRNASASQLAKICDVDRRTIYDVLSKLYQKGFCSLVKKNGVSCYNSVSPKVILSDLNLKLQRFESGIPKLSNLSLNSPEEIVEVFSGKNGLVSIAQDIIDSGKIHYGFGAIAQTSVDFPAQLKDFVDKLIRFNLSERIIFSKGDVFTPIPNGEYRVLPKSMIPPTSAILYDDKVAIFINDLAHTVILIRSKEIFSAYLKYFRTFWDLAKPWKG